MFETATEWKILFFCLLIIMTLMFAFLPLISFRHFVSDEKRNRILSICNTFAGGIFLASGFIHLLAEAQDQFHAILPSYPMAFLCASIGFLVTFFMEKVVFYHSHQHLHHSAPPPSHPPSMVDDKHKTYGTTNGEAQGYVKLDERSPLTAASPAIAAPPVVDLEQGTTGHGHSHGTGDSHSHSHSRKKSSKPEETVEDEHKPAATIVVVDHDGPSVIAKYLLLIVLSIHSIISGVALGAESSPPVVQAIGIAIVSHKWVESFAIGVSLIRFEMPRGKFVMLMLIYAVMEPLGALIGYLAVSIMGAKVSEIFQTVTASVAAGTFIYVATIDILAEEFANGVDRWTKVFATTIGFIFLALLPLALDDH